MIPKSGSLLELISSVSYKVIKALLDGFGSISLSRDTGSEGMSSRYSTGFESAATGFRGWAHSVGQGEPIVITIIVVLVQ